MVNDPIYWHNDEGLSQIKLSIERVGEDDVAYNLSSDSNWFTHVVSLTPMARGSIKDTEAAVAATIGDFVLDSFESYGKYKNLSMEREDNGTYTIVKDMSEVVDYASPVGTLFDKFSICDKLSVKLGSWHEGRIGVTVLMSYRDDLDLNDTRTALYS